MNSLYTSGVRQTNSLQADMERLRNGDNSPALLGEPHVFLSFVQRHSTNQVFLNFFFIGQISASFSAMQRTIDDYDSMTKREIIKAKQEKGQMYYITGSSDITVTGMTDFWTGESRNLEPTMQNSELSSSDWKAKRQLQCALTTFITPDATQKAFVFSRLQKQNELNLSQPPLLLHFHLQLQTVEDDS